MNLETKLLEIFNPDKNKFKTDARDRTLRKYNEGGSVDIGRTELEGVNPSWTGYWRNRDMISTTKEKDLEALLKFQENPEHYLQGYGGRPFDDKVVSRAHDSINKAIEESGEKLNPNSILNQLILMMQDQNPNIIPAIQGLQEGNIG